MKRIICTHFIIIDKLSYASSGLDRLRDTGCLDNDRIRVFTNDLINPLPEGLKKESFVDD